MNSPQYDLVISSVPYIEYTAPMAAPALIKGYLKTQGFSVLACDLNVDVRLYIDDPMVISELVEYWIGGDTPLTEKTQKIYHDCLEHFAKKFAAYKTRYLGFSIFSPHSQRFALDFFKCLYDIKDPATSIVIGGYGTDVIFLNDVNHLIDYYIKGEGELALKELLLGNFDYPGINSEGIQIDDLDQTGYSDYSDYDLTKGYDNWYDGTTIQITGSRGCIRSCSFCDVPDIWKKYRYRSGDSLAREIITNYETTGVKHYRFTDSLINGNLKQLMSMMRILTEYKIKNKADITWGGQWIVRNQRGLPKDYYSLIKSSGGFNIIMGIETGSDAVREHMQKQFTNEELDAEMEQFARHKIACAFYIMVGYPTETEEDFKETLRMFKRYTKYVASGTIIGMALGRGFHELPNTPISRSNIVVFKDNSKKKWASTVANSNYLESIRRRIIAQLVTNQLSWPGGNVKWEILQVIANSNVLFNESDRPYIKELIKTKSIDVDPEFSLPTEPYPIKLDIELESPTEQIVNIEINGILYTNTVSGYQTLSFAIDKPRHRNLIKINLPGDDPDRNIALRFMTIDGVILDNVDIYLQGRTRLPNGEIRKTSSVNNDELFHFYFANPVHKYFIKQRHYYYEENYETSRELLGQVAALFEHFVRD